MAITGVGRVGSGVGQRETQMEHQADIIMVNATGNKDYITGHTG